MNLARPRAIPPGGKKAGVGTLARYARPRSLGDALDLLAGSRWRVLAGGTDVYPAIGAGPPRDDVLDITLLSELTGISDVGDHVVIGGLTRWTDIVRASL